MQKLLHNVYTGACVGVTKRHFMKMYLTISVDIKGRLAILNFTITLQVSSVWLHWNAIAFYRYHLSLSLCYIILYNSNLGFITDPQQNSYYITFYNFTMLFLKISSVETNPKLVFPNTSLLFGLKSRNHLKTTIERIFCAFSSFKYLWK